MGSRICFPGISPLLPKEAHLSRGTPLSLGWRAVSLPQAPAAKSRLTGLLPASAGAHRRGRKAAQPLVPERRIRDSNSPASRHLFSAEVPGGYAPRERAWRSGLIFLRPAAQIPTLAKPIPPCLLKRHERGLVELHVLLLSAGEVPAVYRPDRGVADRLGWAFEGHQHVSKVRRHPDGRHGRWRRVGEKEMDAGLLRKGVVNRFVRRIQTRLNLRREHVKFPFFDKRRSGVGDLAGHVTRLL
jgi:hypothetical protein